MHHFGISTLTRLSRLLVLVCLLFATAEIAFSQADPELRINDVTLNEGDDPLVQYASEPIEITLSAPSTKDVKVTITTQQDTATSGVDFPAVNFELTIPAGQRSILVSAAHSWGDTTIEGTEQFFVVLSNPVNATIGDGQAVATIIDDDALLLLTQPSSQRAAALDSVTFTQEIFPITETVNFSSDSRTRISVFATGWKGSAITDATAEDLNGIVLAHLTVEFVDKVPVGKTPKQLSWLTQVVLKLEQISNLPRDVKIRIFSGAQSNAVLVGLKSQ